MASTILGMASRLEMYPMAPARSTRPANVSSSWAEQTRILTDGQRDLT